jgi:hypothetical protein
VSLDYDRAEVKVAAAWAASSSALFATKNMAIISMAEIAPGKDPSNTYKKAA